MTRRSFGHIRKLPSRKYQASYVGSYGRRINAPYTFLTRSDASAWLSAEEVKFRRTGEKPATSTLALAVDSPQFETYLERHIKLQTTSSGSLLRESTKTLYRRLLRVNLRQFHGQSMSEISVSDVNEWWAKSIGSGKRSIASKAYKLLSAAMKRAVNEGIIESNPCRVKGAQGAITGKKILVPTFDEVKQIASNITPRYSKLVLLLAFSGLRFGEITELRRKDVIASNINGKVAYLLRVERAVTLVSDLRNGNYHLVDKPKSFAGIREVIVPSGMTETIEQILNDAPKGKDALLFPAASDPKNHLRHDVFMNSWRRALKRSGIPEGKYSPHCLRHFAGTNLHEAGATIPELKEWLGDSSTAAVMRYTHTTGRTPGIVDRMLSAGDLPKIG